MRQCGREFSHRRTDTQPDSISVGKFAKIYTARNTSHRKRNGTIYTAPCAGYIPSGPRTSATIRSPRKPFAGSTADPSVGIQHVSKACAGGLPCSDLNDGLTWGSAKQTVYAAILALPGGLTSPPTAGNGKVLVANTPAAGVPYGGPAAPNGGWWMFGTVDANYAAGKTGWMRAPTTGGVTVECASPNVGTVSNHSQTCLEYWGGHADNVHPAVWFSGFAGQATLRGFTFNYEASGFKVGIDSNGNRNGDVNSAGVASIWFDQDAMGFGACYANIGAGPAVDIGGNTFWIKFTDGSYSGCNPAHYNITAISRTSNVVTVTVDHSATNDIVADGLSYIIVRNVADQTFNGGWLIASTPSATTFTYADTGPDTTSSGGQAIPYGGAAIGLNAGGGPGVGRHLLGNVSLNSASFGHRADTMVSE